MSQLVWELHVPRLVQLHPRLAKTLTRLLPGAGTSPCLPKEMPYTCHVWDGCSRQDPDLACGLALLQDWLLLVTWTEGWLEELSSSPMQSNSLRSGFLGSSLWATWGGGRSSLHAPSAPPVLVTGKHPDVAHRRRKVSQGLWSNPVTHEHLPRVRKKTHHM